MEALFLVCKCLHVGHFFYVALFLIYFLFCTGCGNQSPLLRFGSSLKSNVKNIKCIFTMRPHSLTLFPVTPTPPHLPPLPPQRGSILHFTFVFQLKTPIALWPRIDFIGRWPAANPVANEISGNCAKCSRQQRKWFSTPLGWVGGWGGGYAATDTEAPRDGHVMLRPICMWVCMSAPASSSLHVQHLRLSGA